MLKEPASEDDDTPLIDHLRAHERATGEPHPLLVDPPTLPDGCEALWPIFLELHSCRAIGMDAQRITYADIDAYQRVSGIALAQWELLAIRRADAAYLKRR